MRRLNLDQLHSFSLVITHGSFSAAAERLGLSQPAISLQIRQLEQRLGVRLIERVGKRAKASAAGLVLLEHSRHIDAAVEGALHAMQHQAEGVSGRIALGTGATACIHLLPPLLRRLKASFPALDVRVSTGHTRDILKAVEDNRLDLALVTLPASGPSLQITPLLQDPFVAIFAAGEPDLPLAVNPASLATRPLVLFDAGSSTRRLIDDWFLQGGQDPRPIMELGSIEAIKEMVAAGLGCSLVPRMAVTAEHHRRELQVLALQSPLIRTLAIAVRQDKPLSRGLQHLLQHLNTLSIDERTRF
ncbi:MAG: LysR family transcriptional regulator [Pseudomonas sp.]|uniref:LysR family transcriptional regulator n=1 Tax=Pseudomonas sp. TaxID=306 RepID=UPI003396CCF2